MLSLPEEAQCQHVLLRCGGLSPSRQHALSEGSLLEFAP